MASRSNVLLASLVLSSMVLAAEPITISGLKNPESAAVGPGGFVYVTLIGQPNRAGDGSIAIVDPLGRSRTFVGGLDDPKGMLFLRNSLYVADVKRIWKIDDRGKVEVFVGPEEFPRRPRSLSDIAHDGLGNFYVSDGGDRAGRLGAVFRIDARRRVTQVLDGELSSPQITVPDGLLVDDPDHLLVGDFGLGYLYRYDLITGTPQRLGGGFGSTDGLASDPAGRLFLSDRRNGRIFQVSTEFIPPTLLSDKFRSPAGISVTPDGRTLLVPDPKAGTLTWFPIR